MCRTLCVKALQALSDFTLTVILQGGTFHHPRFTDEKAFGTHRSTEWQRQDANWGLLWLGAHRQGKPEVKMLDWPQVLPSSSLPMTSGVFWGHRVR